MNAPLPAVARLAADLVAIDSRSSLSNLAVAERIEAELAGFEVERLDYRDAAGVAKRALVAHRGPPGGYALSGHMDTVPDDRLAGRSLVRRGSMRRACCTGSAAST